MPYQVTGEAFTGTRWKPQQREKQLLAGGGGPVCTTDQEKRKVNGAVGVGAWCDSQQPLAGEVRGVVSVLERPPEARPEIWAWKLQPCNLPPFRHLITNFDPFELLYEAPPRLHQKPQPSTFNLLNPEARQDVLFKEKLQIEVQQNDVSALNLMPAGPEALTSAPRLHRKCLHLPTSTAPSLSSHLFPLMSGSQAVMKLHLAVRPKQAWPPPQSIHHLSAQRAGGYVFLLFQTATTRHHLLLD